MKKENENDFIKEIIFFVISGIIITSLCFVVHYFPVNAATGHGQVPDNDNTYISEWFPCGQNDNEWPMADILSLVATTGNIDYSEYERQLFCGIDVGYYSGFLIVSDGFINAEVNSDLHSFNLYRSGSDTFRAFEVQCGKDFTWCNVWERDYLPSMLESSLYSSSYSYVSNYSVWTTSNPSNAKLVINYMSPPPWDTSAPNPFEPTPEDTPNTPPSPPSWDNNLSVGENLGNLIKWLGNTVTYLINNLKENLYKWFDTIKKTIENAITTFYENMRSLFKPFIDKITETFDYITEGVNPTDIVNSLSETQIFTDINGLISGANSFGNFFNDITEPEECKLALHLENIEILNCNTVYIDFTVIASSRPLIRTFLMALVTFVVFFTILDSLPSYVNGGQDE